MFLLQAIRLFYIDRPSTYIPLIILSAFIFLFIIIAIRMKHKKITGGNSSGTYNVGNATHGSLRRIAILYALESEQIRFLKEYCRKNSIDNPEFYLRNDESTDKFFKMIFHQIDESDSKDKEKEKSILFSIRQSIAIKRREEKRLTTTKNIPTAQSLILITKQGERYPSSVIKNTPYGLSCEVPRDPQRNEIQLPAMSKITVFFLMKTGIAYAFQGRIIRYDLEDDHSLMIIAHTDALKVLRERKYSRKNFNTSCTFSVTDAAEKKIHVDPSARKFRGVLSDISAGGCSIRTLTPVGEKRYINIEFQISGESSDTVTGAVVKLNKLDADAGYTMHIRFTRMSAKTQNRIFSFIYDYDRAAL